MKLYIGSFFAWLFGAISLTFAQRQEQFQFDLKILYEVTYLSDSLDKSSLKSEMTQLLIGEGTSLFRSSKKAYDDSLYMSFITSKVITMSEPEMLLIGDIDPFNYQVLKYFSSNQTKVYDEFTGENLNNIQKISYYFEPQEAMSSWAIKDDTLTINGYLCQRAEIEFGGRKWIAWFSSESLPYSDGPYKFRGLPGLIFRVHDEKKTWDFELVELSKIDTLVKINFKEGLNFAQTTKKKLYRDRRRYQKNQVEIMETGGRNFGKNKSNVKNNLQEFILRDNNWIELDF